MSQRPLLACDVRKPDENARVLGGVFPVCGMKYRRAGRRLEPLISMPNQQSRIIIESGTSFLVELDPSGFHEDPISVALSAGQFPLMPLFRLLRESMPVGARVLDLGAHVGSFSLAAAAAGYEVLAVDASPKNVALIEASARANGFSNLRVLNAAVSDKFGKLRFFSRGPYGHVVSADDPVAAVEVDAFPVSEILERAGWASVAFIKLDIEGSEVAAIRGMRDIMRGAVPPLLFCESNGHMLGVFGESPETLKDELRQLGCELYLVEGHELIPVSTNEIQGSTVVDYVAALKLPETLRAKVRTSSLNADEQLSRIAVAAASANEDERRYAAMALARAGLSGTRANKIRRALLEDSAARVREAAKDIPVAPEPQSRPWWRILG